MKEKQKLNITFHNPNTGDELANALIKICAQMSNETVKKKLLELEQEEKKTDPLQNKVKNKKDKEWER